MGGGVNISGANEEAKKLAELTQVPVITTIMGKGALPTNHGTGILEMLERLGRYARILVTRNQ